MKEIHRLALATVLTNLDEVAAELGVTVRSAAVPGTRWGIYDHRYRLITLRPDLGPIQYRCTLAHELGHAHYGHVSSRPKQERQANLWASRQLLTLEMVAACTTEATEAIEVAHRLEVLPWVVQSFIETLSERELRLLLGRIREHST